MYKALLFFITILIVFPALSYNTSSRRQSTNIEDRRNEVVTYEMAIVILSRKIRESPQVALVDFIKDLRVQEFVARLNPVDQRRISDLIAHAAGLSLEEASKYNINNRLENTNELIIVSASGEEFADRGAFLRSKIIDANTFNRATTEARCIKNRLTTCYCGITCRRRINALSTLTSDVIRLRTLGNRSDELKNSSTPSNAGQINNNGSGAVK